MGIQYHKLLDRILVRRAGERESLERQVGENQPAPKIALALFCFMLAGLFLVIGILPVALILALGGVISLLNAFSTWRQSRSAGEALEEETKDEEYRRYLLAKLGPHRFDQLAAAIAAGGSDQSIRGWLTPLGLDDHDIEYLLWLAENIVAQVKEGVDEVGGYGPGKGRPAARPVPPAPKPEAAPESEKEVSEHRNLSPQEVEKFKQLAVKRKAEYEAWLANGGGRSGAPDDPLGKLGKFTPEQIAELKKKAQERRKKGEAPQSQAPAPAGADHPGSFSEEEMRALELKALQRFEPRPKADGAAPDKRAVLGEVFGAEDMQNLASKAQRQEKPGLEEKERARKSQPKADDNDASWSE